MMKGTKAVAGMNIKRLVFGICMAFVLLGAFMGASVASAKTIYVPDDYGRIQWAVDNASAGDTIVVRDGTYVENIDINKPHLTIKSENGSANCVVRAANSKDHVFYVTADNVTIKGFTVTGARYYYYPPNNNGGIVYYLYSGIYFYYSNNCRIENVNASNNNGGIVLFGSSNIIANNIVSSNNDVGIYLFDSNNNIIANNNVSSNNGIGIELEDSSNNIIANNIVSNNHEGIYLDHSTSNIIANNIVSSNNQYGILLYYYPSNNTVANNTVSNNDYGIYLCYSSNNIIYLNNFINNTDQVYSYASTNIWNSTEKITYTYLSLIHISEPTRPY